jgi:hypothetical protein
MRGAAPRSRGGEIARASTPAGPPCVTVTCGAGPGCPRRAREVSHRVLRVKLQAARVMITGSELGQGIAG